MMTDNRPYSTALKSLRLRFSLVLGNWKDEFCCVADA